MIWAVIGVVIFTSACLLMGWMLVAGLRSGAIQARGATYSRSSQPIYFWMTASVYVAFIVFWIVIVGSAVVTTLRYR